jgi:hypothetical protein
MDRFKRRLFFVAIATALVLGSFVPGSGPVASGGECDCVGGYNYAYDGQPCSPPGSNCMVCTCPPSAGPKQQN